MKNVKEILKMTQKKRYFIKQKLYGVISIIIGIISIAIGCGTAMLIFGPLGLILITTKDMVIMDDYYAEVKRQKKQKRKQS